MNRLDTAMQNALTRQRLTTADALTLFHEAPLLELARLAHLSRLHHHPEPVVTYVVDRNINYTNVCVSACLFCAFHRDQDSPEAYIISKEALRTKIEETLFLGGTQILLQGGMHPALDLDYYLDLLRFIKGNFTIHIHGFSPTEIDFIAKKSGLTVTETLTALVAAGLDSIPGGGAEILVDEVRKKISPHKCSAEDWLNVMRCAHRMGLKSTATMMFGHIESPEHIISHLVNIRDLQDDTGGFTAFIPWTFQPDNTRIRVQAATAAEYLRVLALSRLFLDNVPNVQASWVTQGDKIAQMALTFGANDMGSTLIEENVVAAAGVHFRLPESEMVRLIEAAGYRAVQRDCFYRAVSPEHSS
ncbi:MAG: cyclic dehypoxanthinyl futalosine synthase [Desulfobacterales bacterium]|jgi:cyclic dehypoxanthinyl futalosine synthase|nr:cyclic dehypoxanthinyl futalosine synthase [Desulfobacterales bacterium]